MTSLKALKIFVSLLTVMGPFTCLPTFIVLTGEMSRVERYRIARKATTISFFILLVAALVGEAVFELIGISVPSFRIAGGVVMLLMGISMLQAKKTSIKSTKSEIEEAMEKDDISVFPLATPLIAGPGAISTVFIYANESGKFINIGTIVLASALSCIIIYFLLKYSKIIQKVMGKTGLNIITRLMGLILSALAVEFIINGIKASFNL
jgi:multiple antibiotic resistance protein